MRRYTKRGEVRKYFNEVVLAHDGDDCLLWPFSKSQKGYGKMYWDDGGSRLVSRLVCRIINGPSPTAKHQAAHSCGNGHLGCVSANHLSWKTSAENNADKVIHGTTNRGERCPSAKLTESDIHEIRALKGSMTQRKIAALFNVTDTEVSAIYLGKKWKWLPLKQEELSDV